MWEQVKWVMVHSERLLCGEMVVKAAAEREEESWKAVLRAIYDVEKERFMEVHKGEKID